jgi:hypothetical protein
MRLGIIEEKLFSNAAGIANRALKPGMLVHFDAAPGPSHPLLRDPIA